MTRRVRYQLRKGEADGWHTADTWPVPDVALQDLIWRLRSGVCGRGQPGRSRMTAWLTVVATAQRSAVLRRDSGHLRRELARFVPRARHADALGRRWLSGQRQAPAPFGRRADRPRHEPPAAVRADIAELADAAGAERAPRLRGRCARHATAARASCPSAPERSRIFAANPGRPDAARIHRPARRARRTAGRHVRGRVPPDVQDRYRDQPGRISPPAPGIAVRPDREIGG